MADGKSDTNEKKYADQTVENKVVNGMKVRTYTLNDEKDTLFKVMTEEEMRRAESDYERRQMEEAERRFKEREERLRQQLSGEMEDTGFESSGIPIENGAGSISLDTEHISEAIEEINKDDRIVCIGDSITYGYQVEGSMTWIGTLRREQEINLLNVGLDGDTTENMLMRFHEHVVDLHAKAVLIMGGGNDIMGGTPNEFVNNNIATMSEFALKYGIVPMIGVEPEPDHKNVPNNWKTIIDYDAARENLAIFKQWLITFAKANMLPLLDFDTAMKSRLRGGYGRFFMDGIHPNPAGHRIMADIAKEFFQSLKWLPPDPPKEDRLKSMEKKFEL